MGHRKEQMKELDKENEYLTNSKECQTERESMDVSTQTNITIPFSVTYVERSAQTNDITETGTH